MSKDIRSFFKIRPKTNEVSRPTKSSDDEIIPESPQVQIEKKKKGTKKRRILNDSSDEEIFHKTTKSTKQEKSHHSQKSHSKEVKPKLKEVQATDIFGSAPIKRTEPIVKKSKIKTETGIHSDDEFEKSLLQLDNSEIKLNSKPTFDKSDQLQEIPKQTVPNSNKSPKTTPVKNEKYINSTDDQPTTSTFANISLNDSVSKNEKKRDFSMFIESEGNELLNKTEDTSKTKKRKVDKTLNESAISDEERHEKKRLSAILYQHYLNRTGPKHLGSKQIPEGTAACLKDCAFLLTGVLDSFERDEITAAIAKFGGTVKSGISRKVTHVLAGEDAGPSKLAKAQELGIRILNEDEFLKLIEERSKNKPESSTTKQDIKSEGTNLKTPKKKIDKTPNGKSDRGKNKLDSDNNLKDMGASSKLKVLEENVQKNFYGKNNGHNKLRSEEKSPENKPSTSNDTRTVAEVADPPSLSRGIDINSQLMWVDKYKPQTLKQIIGQHGEASNAKKLSNWLMRWYINRKEKIAKPNPWSKNDDGAYYKAALLSGPPGVGKTTTVALVCKELGFDMVEFNASDTRSKTLIKEQITELLTTTSLSGFARGDTGKQAITKKHVLVMDEVDGMAGNEDRGGMQELISLIKIAAVPIVCMCNDRNSQKMRSLVNYCYDLKFSRPRVDQIKSAMMSVCFKEGVKIHPDALTQLILSSNQDIRQTLNMLSLWSVNSKQLDTDQVKKDSNNSKKDLKLGPWEAVRKVFSAEEHKTMSIHDKSDLFFYDYSLAPLFVQENYLQVVPHCPKNEVLERVSMAADSISMGDLIEARIRSRGNWNLLPMQAMYSSVLPGHAMSGHVAGQIQFPGWLGKNSRANKLARLCQEIHAHTRLSTSGSKSSIFLDYSTHLRDAIVNPLVKEKADGIPKSIEILQSYHLLRDDLDSLTELSMWPGQRDPMLLVDSKVKAAMTRTYNKEASALPYAPGAVKRGRGRVDGEGDLNDADEAQDEDAASDSDPENDALIKKKKKPAKAKDTEKPSTSFSEKARKGKGKKSSSTYLPI